MSGRLTCGCDQCGELVSVVLPEPGADQQVVCPSCARTWGFDDESRRLERCSACGCSRLYRQRAFPRRLGIGLVLLGALASVWTYGLSLVAVFVIDLLIYRLVPEMVVCYLCRAELHGIEVPARVLPFRHHLAAGYEQRREQWLESAGRARAVWAARGVDTVADDRELQKKGIP